MAGLSSGISVRDLSDENFYILKELWDVPSLQVSIEKAGRQRVRAQIKEKKTTFQDKYKHQIKLKRMTLHFK